MTVAAHLDGVVTFPDGLPGFETSRRFVLVASTSLAPFTIVQGTDGRAPSFVAIEPRLVEPEYAEPLASVDLSRLGADPGDALLWLALVAAPPDGSAATVNLRAPLVVNPKSMLGIQLIAAESAYRTDHPLQPV